MTTRTFTFNVTAPASSVVASIAAELQAASPSAPMWSTELPTVSSRYLAATHPLRPADATKINDIIGSDGTGLAATGNRAWKGWNPSSTQHLVGNAGPYSSDFDPDSGNWWHVAGTTGSGDSSQSLIRYNLARDEFRHWQAPVAASSAIPRTPLATALWPGWGGAHNFGQSALDTIGRRIYRMLNRFDYQVAGDPTGNYKLAWASIDDPTQRGMIDQWVPGSTRYPPIELIRGSGFGASGSLVQFLWGSSAVLYRFDIALGQWFQDVTPPFAFTQFPAVVNCNGAVYGASGQAGNTFWRLNADGTFTTTLAPTPVQMNGRAYYSGAGSDYYTVQFAAVGTNIYAFYPGNPLTGQEGYVYKYDTLADVWTTVDRMVQIATGVRASLDQYIGFSVVGVTSLGVVLLAQNAQQESDYAIVWKP